MAQDAILLLLSSAAYAVLIRGCSVLGSLVTRCSNDISLMADGVQAM